MWLSVSVLSCMHCPRGGKRKEQVLFYMRRLCSLSKSNIYFVVMGKSHAGQNKLRSRTWLCSPFGTAFLMYCSYVAGTTIIHEGDAIVDSHFTGARDFPEKDPVLF